MTAKIISVLAVFALISSSHQASFKEDIEAFLTPWVNAALTAMPLVKMVIDEEQFLETQTVGMDPNMLGTIYSSTQKKLTQLESQTKSEESKSCMSDVKGIFKTSTEKFQTDGYCLKMQQIKANEAIYPLIKAIFPTMPTAACPIPILCKINLASLTSFSPRSIKEAMGLLKDLQKYVTDLLKLVVYFKKEITECRKNPEQYEALSKTVMRLATLCVKK